MLRRSLSPGSHRIQKLTDQQQKLMEADYKNASEMVMNYHKQRLTLFIAILPALGLFSRELLWSSTGGNRLQSRLKNKWRRWSSSRFCHFCRTRCSPN